MNATRKNVILPKEWKIITHYGPHFDELLALWLLWYKGAEKYPGIGDALVYQRGDQPEERDGEWLFHRLGVIALGWGFGRFDEHPDPNRSIPRKEGECCATLVAKDLGIQDDPVLLGMLKYALKEDEKSGTGKNHLPSVIQALHRQGIGFQVVVDWALAGITAKYRDAEAGGTSVADFSIEKIAELMLQQYPDNSQKAKEWLALGVKVLTEQQRHFEDETAKEYATVITNGQFQSFIRVGIKGKWKDQQIQLRVVYTESDDPQLGTFIRFKGAAVAIIKNSAGQVQILLNKDCMQHGLRLDYFVRKLRIEEQRAAGRVREGRPEVLALEGTLRSDGRWHWFPGAQVILDGGFTAPHVPPTRLSIEQIAEWICKEFDQSNRVPVQED